MSYRHCAVLFKKKVAKPNAITNYLFMDSDNPDITQLDENENFPKIGWWISLDSLSTEKSNEGRFYHYHLTDSWCRKNCTENCMHKLRGQIYFFRIL